MVRGSGRALAARLEADGLLLVQDATLPSVATLVAGGPIRGSWWAHPEAHAIFRALGALADRPDVLLAKLVSGKNTLVHRRLWPALLAVGLGRARWQMDGLTAGAKALLAELDRSGEPQRDTDAAGKELDLRLLVTGREVHSERGRHVLEQRSWASFARDQHVTALPLDDAQRELEQALGDAADRLPWRSGPRPRRR